MRRTLPPLYPLRAFEAVARLGSVARAADELNLTKGAVSHQIRSLEESLEQPLFERDKRTLKLTQAGSVYARQVRQALRMLAEGTMKLGLPSVEGRLHIACPPALANCWLAQSLRDFRRAFPDIELEIRPVNLNDEAIRAGDYDLAIVYGHGNWQGPLVRVLTQIQMYPVCHPTFIAGSGQPRELGQLSGRSLLHEDDGGNWKRWLAEVGAQVEEIEHGTYLWSAQLSLEAAAAGAGVALGDDIVCASYFEHGRLTRLFDTAFPAHGAYYLLCDPQRLDEPRILLFSDWLYEQMRKTSRQAGQYQGPGAAFSPQ